MQMFCIADSQQEEFWGPYTDRALAGRILKIVQAGVDEGAEIVCKECDEWAKEILSGLLPWKIVVLLEDGKILETSCTVTWPPAPQEGIIQGEELPMQQEQVEYFAWAKTAKDAKLKLARLNKATSKAAAEA
jgi:hypothetical protein